MQYQPSEAALAANLLDPHHVRMVCRTIENGPDAIAREDQSEAAADNCILDCAGRSSDIRRQLPGWKTEPDPVSSPAQRDGRRP